MRGGESEVVRERGREGRSERRRESVREVVNE